MLARATVVLLALAALMPLATAGSLQAALTASSATWSANDIALSSTFVGASSLWPATSTSFPTPDESDFVLNAPRISAEWNTSSAYVDAPGAVYVPAGTGHGGATYTTAHLEGTASGTQRALYVFPDGAVKLEAPCGNTQIPQQSTIKAVPHISGDSRIADTSNAIQITPCAAPTLTGDFTVILWDWNGHLTSQEGSTDLWSGKQQQDQVPVDGQPYVSKAQQLYLHVTGGTLTLPVASVAPEIYVASATFTGASQLTLTDAAGTLAGQGVQAQTLQLTGSLDAALSRSGDHLSLQVADGVRGADVDGHTLSLVVPAGGGHSGWQWVGFGAVLVPVAAIPVGKRYMARPRRIDQLVGRVHEYVNTENVPPADRLSEKLLRLAPNSAKVRLARARVLAYMGEYEIALAQHKIAAELTKDVALRGENAFHAALVAAKLSRPSAANETRDWLLQALEANSLFWFDAEIHPELAPFLPSLSVAALLADLLRP